MKRVRIEEFFHDFDKLRKGRVTKAQFESILSMLNFNLSKQEFEALAAKYKTNDPEYFVCYKDFCASVNSAFTVYGIQQDPLAKVARVTNEVTTKARRKYLDFNDEERQMLQGILQEYQTAVSIKRLNLKQMLLYYPRCFQPAHTRQLHKEELMRRQAIVMGRMIGAGTGMIQ